MKFHQKAILKGLAITSISVMALGIWSCSTKSDPISAEVTQTASNLATVNSQTSEVDDIVTSQLNTTDNAPGRMETEPEDNRVKCAVITKNISTDKMSGSITIDFGKGCKDEKGNLRTGKIMIAWTGRWYLPGSSHTIKFADYSINGVKFSNEDFRTVTNISSTEHPLTFTIEATHDLSWPDGTSSTSKIHHTRQWVRSSTFIDDKIIISQTVGAHEAESGTNRHKKSYSIQIKVPLEYWRSCAISNKVYKPVKGVVVITYDTNKTITIDYGNGTCDNTFTITRGSQTTTITAKNDGSDD